VRLSPRAPSLLNKNVLLVVTAKVTNVLLDLAVLETVVPVVLSTQRLMDTKLPIVAATLIANPLVLSVASLPPRRVVLERVIGATMSRILLSTRTLLQL